jgi:hypothetical protein
MEDNDELSNAHASIRLHEAGASKTTEVNPAQPAKQPKGITETRRGI